jgi:hypothetical protein
VLKASYGGPVRISHTLSTTAREKAASTPFRSGPQGTPALNLLFKYVPGDSKGTPVPRASYLRPSHAPRYEIV